MNEPRNQYPTPAAYATAKLEEAAAAADYLAALVRARGAQPARCSSHPAYDADYCPVCGTTTLVGER